MAGLAYYSTSSGNTRRFVEALGLPALRIGADTPRIERPFVLICPTYADDQGAHAVPKPVIHFLNVPENRALLRGVIAAGNRNFGRFFGRAGDVIAAKCGVPCLYRFELAGTEQDRTRVKQGLERFWKR